jgi:hypothetical protein
MLLAGMTMRLWNYVATFSNMSGEQLHDLYLKLSQDLEGGVGPSHGGNFASIPPSKGGNSNLGLSSTLLSLSITVRTLEVLKPGSVGGELIQITNLTLSLCTNLPQ